MSVRVCPLRWPDYRKDNSVYRLSKCEFCKEEIIDRKDVKEDEPPAVCRPCSQKYYGGTLKVTK